MSDIESKAHAVRSPSTTHISWSKPQLRDIWIVHSRERALTRPSVTFCLSGFRTSCPFWLQGDPWDAALRAGMQLRTVIWRAGKRTLCLAQSNSTRCWPTASLAPTCCPIEMHLGPRSAIAPYSFDDCRLLCTSRRFDKNVETFIVRRSGRNTSESLSMRRQVHATIALTKARFHDDCRH